MGANVSTPPQDMPFGDALAELEGIVASLERGDLDLERSMECYERGVVLLKALQARLAEAEQRVTMLVGELESESDDAAG